MAGGGGLRVRMEAAGHGPALLVQRRALAHCASVQTRASACRCFPPRAHRDGVTESLNAGGDGRGVVPWSGASSEKPAVLTLDRLAPSQRQPVPDDVWYQHCRDLSPLSSPIAVSCQ